MLTRINMRVLTRLCPARYFAALRTSPEPNRLICVCSSASGWLPATALLPRLRAMANSLTLLRYRLRLTPAAVPPPTATRRYYHDVLVNVVDAAVHGASVTALPGAAMEPAGCWRYFLLPRTRGSFPSRAHDCEHHNTAFPVLFPYACRPFYAFCVSLHGSLFILGTMILTADYSSPERRVTCHRPPFHSWVTRQLRHGSMTVPTRRWTVRYRY